MASKLPDSVPSPDSQPFIKARIVIENAFNSLIHKLEIRRDQLLGELHEMGTNYFSKEETRIKSIKDIDQLKMKIQEATIEQNYIANVQAEEIEKMRVLKEKFQSPTQIPFPQFDASHLEELREQIEVFGSLQDMATQFNTKVQPIRSIGKKGKGKIELLGPYGIATDGKLNLYVAEVNNGRIQVLSLDGQFIREFGKGELARPQSLSLYKDWLFVADFSKNKVLKYHTQNYQLECQSELGLNYPYGIAVDSDEVFVADRHNNRIVVLSLDLTFIRELRDKVKKPRDVKVNRDQVFVANNDKPHNIHIFSKQEGNMIKSIITLINGSGSILLCFDKFNNILISDCLGKIVQVYTTEGDLVHSIKCDFNPTGIAVTRDNIICADYYAHKLHLY